MFAQNDECKSRGQPAGRFRPGSVEPLAKLGKGQNDLYCYSDWVPFWFPFWFPCWFSIWFPSTARAQFSSQESRGRFPGPTGLRRKLRQKCAQQCQELHTFCSQDRMNARGVWLFVLAELVPPVWPKETIFIFFFGGGEVGTQLVQIPILTHTRLRA